MTGYHAEDYYNDLYGTLEKIYYPDDIPVIEAHVKEAVADPVEPLYLIHRIIRRDGEVRWIEHSCQSVYDAEGNYAGRRSCNRDITKQKLAEELLKKSHQEMEQRVKDRTAELTATVEKLHAEIDERKRAESELQKERRGLAHLLRSSDHERQLIAYEIHDGLSQYLAGAIMAFQACEFAKNSDPDHAAKAFETGMLMLQRGHAEARHLINGVRPPILDELGIVAAISHLVFEHNQSEGMMVEFDGNVKFERLESILENAIYRIVQESLSNACRHSGSSKARIELRQNDGRLRIEIRDWGRGFAVNESKEGSFGLEGIRERARLLGGSVSIESEPGEGTRVIVDLPLF
jgi:PAS domain S-box-containing protein